MPELPDVEGSKRYLDSTSLHQEIEHAAISDERIVKHVSLRTLRNHLEGSELSESHRHGKYLFAALSRGGDLVLHFGMTGFLHYDSDLSQQPGHTKLALRFTSGGQLAYVNVRRLGEISYTNDRAAFIEEHELGPDALDDSLDRDTFIKSYKGRRGSVKGALMNQSIVAGIGNVYSDEILFQAGIDPRTNVNSLDEDTLGDIYGVMRRVLRTAADHGGNPGELPDDWLLPVVQAGGETCPGCKGKIEKVKVSGRSAHYCPECQKRY
ncbi:MAG: Fpg/Nei family DNA glycosylase [Chloroflexota bacterium]